MRWTGGQPEPVQVDEGTPGAAPLIDPSGAISTRGSGATIEARAREVVPANARQRMGFSLERSSFSPTARTPHAESSHCAATSAVVTSVLTVLSMRTTAASSSRISWLSFISASRRSSPCSPPRRPCWSMLAADQLQGDGLGRPGQLFALALRRGSEILIECIENGLGLRCASSPCRHRIRLCYSLARPGDFQRRAGREGRVAAARRGDGVGGVTGAPSSVSDCRELSATLSELCCGLVGFTYQAVAVPCLPVVVVADARGAVGAGVDQSDVGAER